MLQEYLHGGVTCADIEKVLLAKGFEPVSFPGHNSYSVKTKVARFFYLFKMFYHIKKRGVLFFISPVYAKMNRLLLTLLRIKGMKLVCIIADIDGLRDGDDHLLQKEIQQYRRFTYFIVHNDQMAEYIAQFVPHAVFYTLDFFDYLVLPLKNVQRIKSNNILFAGNLAKSSFLDNLYSIQDTNPDIIFHLYGPGVTEKITGQKNVSYHGVFRPDDLVARLEGSFGLIWDGESIETCSGSYGEYIRYNLQHKLSLYIVSCLPVIVWEGAATATLVKKYEIGFTVRSLSEIEEQINILSETEYQQMQINMNSLAEKISKGGCLSNAIDEIMKLI